MAFEELNENTERFHADAKSFLENTVAYYKLKVFKLAMQSITLIFKMLLVGLCLSVCLLFGSLAAAFAIGEALNNDSLGFLIVGGMYLLFTLLIYAFRRQLVEGPILRMFSKIFFND